MLKPLPELLVTSVCKIVHSANETLHASEQNSRYKEKVARQRKKARKKW